ncbi:MAG TPA: Flp family type IVb pilin [Candidatus Magasanikbacteria bacterium]|nr:Flp family type IVb pilin [Candidatus Magasanikbacteria bacterium]
MRFISTMRLWLKDEKGQAMSEYALLLVLVAVALIATVIIFRNALKAKFDAITAAIVGA